MLDYPLIIVLSITLFLCFAMGVLCFRYVTAQKELKAYAKYILKNTTDIIYKADVDGNIDYINEAAIAFYGLPIKEMVGKNFKNAIAPQCIEMVTEFYRKQLEEKIDETYLEFQVIIHNGTEVWVGQKVNLIYHKVDTNVVIGFGGVLREINEKKIVELKLAESQQNFRQISETINDVFYLFNLASFKIEYVSPNYLKNLGIERAELYKIAPQYLPFEKDQVLKANAMEMLFKGEPFEVEYRIIVNDQVKWINECTIPIKDKQGNVTMCSGTLRDITESKAAKVVIEKQNREIVESIQYAKIILDSTLPTKQKVLSILPESFIFYEPKNVVSGDFYIVDEIKLNAFTEYKIFIVGDCTGHGVPGGILSVLCNSLLKDTFDHYDNESSVADSLNTVRAKLIKLFQSSEYHTAREGMDIAFCAFEEASQKLYFSGAKNSCLIIRNNELFDYKGDKQHVGYSDFQKPFTLHEIKVEKGDCVYLYSDGYMDQFGGPNNKKFMKKKFKELLLSIHNQSVDEQYLAIQSTFFEWKGEAEQTDDVTVLGVKL